MKLQLNEEEVKSFSEIIKSEKINIPLKEVKSQLELIINSQEIFPLNKQRVLLIKLLTNYKNTKKKEVIILEEVNKGNLPAIIVLGVLAEDWPGMSNSILGIIHHISKNVLFVKGFTIPKKEKTIGIVILAFRIDDKIEYENFVKEKKTLIKKIHTASVGSISKFILLDEETIKFEIFDKLVKNIKKRYKGENIDALIGENGEALKFVLSRSKEYLEERKIRDLADLVIENYKCQKFIRDGRGNEVIRIKNFETYFEKLTGITFVCKELLISIEDFLKTLEYIVPDYIIKHHKSFVTRDGLLVYRLEIVNRLELPLDPVLIKSIENSLKRIIISTQSSKFKQIKSVGGFEHFARAIIPFLMDELENTRLTQVFLNVLNKTDFNIELKIIIVRELENTGVLSHLIPKIDNISGIEISSFTPTKIYRESIKVDILKLNIDLSEFSSIKEIFDKLKFLISFEFGEIRDFDQGLRDIYIGILNRLIENLPDVDSSLIRDIFFNFDELYRVEVEFQVLKEVIRLCWSLISLYQNSPKKRSEIFKYKYLRDYNRTILIVSCFKEKSLLKIFLSHFKKNKINFSKLYKDHRKYYILILDNKGVKITDDFLEKLKTKIKGCS